MITDFDRLKEQVELKDGGAGLDTMLDDVFECKTSKWKIFLYRLPRVPNRMYWWIRHRTTNRYHVLKYRNLTPGWHDVDTRILHACFDLFCDFVEQEKGLENLKFQIDWDGVDTRYPDPRSPEQIQDAKDTYETAKELYDWWQKKIKDPEGQWWHHPNGDTVFKDEAYHLMQLMRIRDSLWT